MFVWIVRDLEPIPTDPGERRLMRTGMLARELARQGHRVRWFTSSFDHYQKRQRAPRRQDVVIDANLEITVLPGPGYRRNISLARIWHNRSFARAFADAAQKSSERPDIILTDIPTTEAAAAAIAFADKQGIPTVLSVRDLWPDFFADHLPEPLRPLARLALLPMERQARFACAKATSLIGISPAYLDWGRKKGKRTPARPDAVFPLGYAASPRADRETDEAILARIGIRPDAAIVAFIGSWGHTYDLRLVLEVARLFDAQADVQFVIAGDGMQSEVLRPQFARLSNVLLPGWISAEEIAVILRRAEIGLLPYAQNAPQGWPNKCFEYLAYGTFQIATIEGELDSFYRQTRGGITLAKPDATGLAQAIRTALAATDRVSARAERIAYFEVHLDADAIYGRMAVHIAQVASGTA